MGAVREMAAALAWSTLSARWMRKLFTSSREDVTSGCPSTSTGGCVLTGTHTAPSTVEVYTWMLGRP